MPRKDEYHIASVSCSPDGRRIVSGGGGYRVNEVLVWNAQTHRCVHVIRGSGDIDVIAAGASWGLPWRAIGRDEQIVIEPAGGGAPVARFPIAFPPITPQPDGRACAGASVNHLYIITLEGDPSARLPERGG